MVEQNEVLDNEIPLGFCINGEFNPPCTELTFYEFPDEKDTITLILEYFKRFLPEVLIRKKDYYNQPIIIDPNDIDLITQKDFGKYVIVLSISDDNSSYNDENFYLEDSEYVFQIDLLVVADDMIASLENLIKLKSAVKTLLTNMDNNLQLRTTVDGFAYGNFGKSESNTYLREGIYRFSVQSDNYRK